MGIKMKTITVRLLDRDDLGVLVAAVRKIGIPEERYSVDGFSDGYNWSNARLLVSEKELKELEFRIGLKPIDAYEID